MRKRVGATAVVLLLAVAAVSGSWAQTVERELPRAGKGEPASLAAPVEVQAASPAVTEIKASQALSEQEGTPFTWNLEAAKYANEGFVSLRQQRFAEAEQAYALAKERDERYRGFYEKVVRLRNSAAEGKLDEAKKEKVRDDLDLTWAQFLGWLREEQRGPMPSLRVWVKDAQGNLMSMPAGPTMVGR